MADTLQVELIYAQPQTKSMQRLPEETKSSGFQKLSEYYGENISPSSTYDEISGVRIVLAFWLLGGTYLSYCWEETKPLKPFVI